MNTCKSVGWWVGMALASLGLSLDVGAQPAPPSSPAPSADYEYDANGNRTKTTQAKGVAGFGFEFRSSFDSLDRPKEFTDARSGVTQFGFDGLGRALQIRDPRLLLTQYLRDGLGEVRQLISPDTGTDTLTYDAVGNVATRTDSRGVLTTFSYDALSRLTSVVFSMPGNLPRTYTWNYDETGAGYGYGVGRLTSATHPAGSAQYGYDALGRLVSAVQRIDARLGVNPQPVVTTVGYEYDIAGKLTAVVYPSGRKLTLSYVGGQLSAMALARSANATPAPLISQVQFEPFGDVKGWLWWLDGGTQAHEFVRDLSGRHVRYRLGPTFRDITYDAADRITAYSHYDAASGAPQTDLDQAFGYDELGRLTSVTIAGPGAPVNWSFGYDASGNRTVVWRDGASSTYTTPAGSNRLSGTTQPERAFAYDEAGNTVVASSNSSPPAAYTASYGPSGRLTGMTATSGSGSVMASYTLDGAGQRVRKFDSSGSASTVIFVHDPAGQLLGEYDRTGKALREYVWLGNIPVAVFTPDPSGPLLKPPLVYPIHTDHLGAPRVVLDTANALRWTWLAEPFGTTAANQDPQGLGPFTFNLRLPGQYFDAETGLHHNGQRDYDPTLGRFVQPDPAGLEGGVDAYGYAMSRPTSFTDPTGEVVPIAAACLLNPTCAAATATLVYGISQSISRCASNAACVDRWKRVALTISANVAAWIRVEQTTKPEQCTDTPCPPCKTVSGKIVPVGTIGYRPMDTPSRPQHGIVGPHFNIYKANQNPNNCQCFWQSVGAVSPSGLPAGAIPIEPFAN
jgi:RHS repeat-associated protein